MLLETTTAPTRRRLPLVAEPVDGEWQTFQRLMHALARRGRRGERVRPRRRSDCAAVPRPCPFVGCRHHLWIRHVGARGQLFAQEREPWDLDHSCSLDVADSGLLRDRETMLAAGLVRPAAGSQRGEARDGELVALGALLDLAKPTTHAILHGALAEVRRLLCS